VAVAVQEVEAWLVADAGALRVVFGAPAMAPAVPEALERREAKALLRDLTSTLGRGQVARALRCDLARTCHLDVVQAACPAFRDFVKALGAQER
jgi:hypothetical protein